MTEAQSLLTRIMGNQLFGQAGEKQTKTLSNLQKAEQGSLAEKLSAIGESGREEVLNEAVQQAVFPIAFDYLKELFPNDESMRKHAKRNSVYTIAGVRNLYAHNHIHQLLDGNGIPYVILKGQASARYYPNPSLRPMGDVDFLVNMEDREKVDQLLREDGFVKIKIAEKHDYHWIYKKDKVEVELHWELPGMPAKENEAVRHYVCDIIDQRVLVSTGDAAYYVPSTFHHGIVLLLHTINHISSSVGLRHLADWLVFAESMSEDEFSKLFHKAFREMGLMTFAKVLTKIGILYFGCKEKNWCKDANENVCREFLEDIFEGGNFGIKEKGRRNQSALIQNRQTKGIAQDSMFRNGISAIRQRAALDYPICEKFPILTPFIWAVVVVQYIVRVGQGKKHNALSRKNFMAAKHRYSLYAKLKLFESDHSANEN